MKIKCLPALAMAAGFSLISTGLGIIQELVYGRRVRRTRIAAPIFIVGHWRTGTTLLHNLLALDPQHTAPNGYECLCPTHFLLSERWLLPLFDLLPRFRRPMDEMAISARSPQEDEFALALLGEPSPYLHFAFPRLDTAVTKHDPENFCAAVRTRWQRTLLSFVQQLTCLRGGRPVLKSPPHSFRIRTLLELFPDARFVHLIRNPYEVVPSTLKMNRALLRLWAMQEITERRLEDHVFERGALLYERLEKEKLLIQPNRFHELRYEDLIRNPLEQLRRLYTQLELSDFDRARPKMAQHLAEVAGHVANTHELSAHLRDEISRRWGHIAERHGYVPPARPADPLRGRAMVTLTRSLSPST